MNCKICKSQNNFEIYDAGFQPTSENILSKNLKESKNLPKAKVKIVVCQNCTHVFNKCFQLKKVNYTSDYNYVEPPSKKFDEHINFLIKYLINKNLKKKYILEIGCGKGKFLKNLCIKGNNKGLGLDTSYVGKRNILSGKISFIKKQFDKNIKLQKKFDFIIARQVVEHIINPIEFFRTIRKNLNQNGKVFFEIPNLDWMLKNLSIWDFYYEHCCYYDYFILKKFLQLTGFKNIKNVNLFNGQYTGVYAEINNKRYSKNKIEFNFKNNSFKMRISNFIAYKKKFDQKKKIIANFCERNKAINWGIWGCAAKGVTFVNSFVKNKITSFKGFDINPQRQNKFLPIKGYKIYKPNQKNLKNTEMIVIMNPNYTKEIKFILKKMNYKGKIKAVHEI